MTSIRDPLSLSSSAPVKTPPSPSPSKSSKPSRSGRPPAHVRLRLRKKAQNKLEQELSEQQDPRSSSPAVSGPDRVDKKVRSVIHHSRQLSLEIQIGLALRRPRQTAPRPQSYRSGHLPVAVLCPPSPRRGHMSMRPSCIRIRGPVWTSPDCTLSPLSPQIDHRMCRPAYPTGRNAPAGCASAKEKGTIRQAIGDEVPSKVARRDEQPLLSGAEQRMPTFGTRLSAMRSWVTDTTFLNYAARGLSRPLEMVGLLSYSKVSQKSTDAQSQGSGSSVVREAETLSPADAAPNTQRDDQP